MDTILAYTDFKHKQLYFIFTIPCIVTLY